MSFKNAKVISSEVNPREYHSVKPSRGDPTYPVSPSMLSDFALCPEAWMKGFQRDPSVALAWGNLVDCLYLTPEQFENVYALHPETYINADGERKKWRNDSRIKEVRLWREENAGKEPIDNDTVSEAWTAVKRLHEDKVIWGLRSDSKTQVYVAGEWSDEKTGLVIPVRCLIDLVPDRAGAFGDCLADVKTCRSARHKRFLFAVHDFGYILQACFDLDLYNAATQENRATWLWILSESRPPYQPGRRMMSRAYRDPQQMSIGTASYQSALSRYCACLKSGVWPGYDDEDTLKNQEGWGLIEPSEDEIGGRLWELEEHENNPANQREHQETVSGSDKT